MKIAAKNAKDREEKEKNLGALVHRLLMAKVLIKLFQKFGPRQGGDFLSAA
jgi:hypothetical protein